MVGSSGWVGGTSAMSTKGPFVPHGRIRRSASDAAGGHENEVGCIRLMASCNKILHTGTSGAASTHGFVLQHLRSSLKWMEFPLISLEICSSNFSKRVVFFILGETLSHHP